MSLGVNVDYKAYFICSWSLKSLTVCSLIDSKNPTAFLVAFSYPSIILLKIILGLDEDPF